MRIALVLVLGLPLFAADQREVAITIDDLPRGGDSGCQAAPLLAMTKKLLTPFRENRIPLTGFVIGSRCPDVQAQALKLWIDAGAELGNHTFDHIDFNETPVDKYIAGIRRAEDPIEKVTGVKPRYFRYPFLHAGATAESRQEVIDYLNSHGYRNAPVTLDDSDYMFARVYAVALAKGDHALAQRVADAYVPYMDSIFAFFEQRSIAVTGHEIRQILLIHASQLNADMMPRLLVMIKARGYRLVSLDRALADEAYKMPDDYVGRGGFSWIHRWSRSVGMNFQSSEPDEPKWITDAWNATRDR
ncbi:MAG TPA: polysaccharide deacetylase family protein [Bryobacteraceae bacterium]|jgi:peptidoglycan/xylan/chitin deacetylase (PgdA/CDA1 family)